jgi:hypothetical protein
VIAAALALVAVAVALIAISRGNRAGLASGRFCLAGNASRDDLPGVREYAENHKVPSNDVLDIVIDDFPGTVDRMANGTRT